MREKICSQEIEVARAARTGVWDSTVQDHAAACAVCTELVIAVTAMQSLVTGFEKDSKLPDAGWLWRTALLEQKQAEADRVQRPLRLAQFSSVPTILALVGWIAWHWAQTEEYVLAQLTVWQTGWWARPWQAFWLFVTGASQLSLNRPFLLVLLLAIAIVLAARPLLAEK